MRGWHAAAVLTGYLCAIGGFGYLVYSSQMDGPASVLAIGSVGSALFKAVAGAVMVTIVLVVPGLVGPAVSGERERQTLELLMVTPLRPSRIVTGKLVAALAFVAFLVVACLPLFSVAFLLGDVGVAQVLDVVAFALVTAFSIGSLSMLVSVALRRTSAATVVSYLVMLLISVGPLIGGYAVQRAFYSYSPLTSSFQGQGTASAIEAVSPAAGIAGLLSGGSCGFGGVITPGFSTVVLPVVNNCGPAAADTANLGPLGTWPSWEATMAFDGVIAIAALATSIALLRRKELS
jgi:ABC-type transport system involved in multi-copper enzyme maturation permease subunit